MEKRYGYNPQKIGRLFAVLLLCIIAILAIFAVVAARLLHPAAGVIFGVVLAGCFGTPAASIYRARRFQLTVNDREISGINGILNRKFTIPWQDIESVSAGKDAMTLVTREGKLAYVRNFFDDGKAVYREVIQLGMQASPQLEVSEQTRTFLEI